MANGIVTGIQEDLLDHVLAVSAYTAPTNVYAALYIGDPAGAGTEETGTDYARVEITFGAAASVGEVSTSSNSAAVDFGTAGSGGWGTVDYVAIFDASTAGNMLAAGALTNARTISAGDPVKFNIGELVVTLKRTT